MKPYKHASRPRSFAAALLCLQLAFTPAVFAKENAEEIVLESSGSDISSADIAAKNAGDAMVAVNTAAQTKPAAEIVSGGTKLGCGAEDRKTKEKLEVYCLEKVSSATDCENFQVVYTDEFGVQMNRGPAIKFEKLNKDVLEKRSDLNSKKFVAFPITRARSAAIKKRDLYQNSQETLGPVGVIAALGGAVFFIAAAINPVVAGTALIFGYGLGGAGTTLATDLYLETTTVDLVSMPVRASIHAVRGAIQKTRTNHRIRVNRAIGNAMLSNPGCLKTEKFASASFQRYVGNSTAQAEDTAAVSNTNRKKDGPRVVETSTDVKVNSVKSKAEQAF